MAIKLIIKKLAKKITEAYRPYSRNAWTVDYSYAWISPKGEFNLVPDGSSHDAWACKHENLSFNEENSAIATYKLSKDGWIRMSNAHDLNVDKFDEITLDAWDAYAKNLMVGVPRRLDPEEFFVGIGINMSSQGWTLDHINIPLVELITRKCSRQVQKDFFQSILDANAR